MAVAAIRDRMDELHQLQDMPARRHPPIAGNPRPPDRGAPANGTGRPRPWRHWRTSICPSGPSAAREATVAREKGLEPLAHGHPRPGRESTRSRPPLPSSTRRRASPRAEEALAGARDILAEIDQRGPDRPAAGCASSSSAKAVIRSTGGGRQGDRGGQVPGLFRLAGAGGHGALPPRARHAARGERGRAVR
ncbi:MAG: hypothetical protein MZV70_37605 [Desulfobacterales bacterium]|nr:hypothetical protein [Desulfobacterales bacterium]